MAGPPRAATVSGPAALRLQHHHSRPPHTGGCSSAAAGELPPHTVAAVEVPPLTAAMGVPQRSPPRAEVSAEVSFVPSQQHYEQWSSISSL